MEDLPTDILNNIASWHHGVYYAMARVFKRLNTDQAEMRRHFMIMHHDEFGLGMDITASRLPNGTYDSAQPSIIYNVGDEQVVMWLGLSGLLHRANGPAVHCRHHSEWFLFGQTQQYVSQCCPTRCSMSLNGSTSIKNQCAQLMGNIANIQQAYAYTGRSDETFKTTYTIDPVIQEFEQCLLSMKHNLKFGEDYFDSTFDMPDLADDMVDNKSWLHNIAESTNNFRENLWSHRFYHSDRVEVNEIQSDHIDGVITLHAQQKTGGTSQQNWDSAG